MTRTTPDLCQMTRAAPTILTTTPSRILQDLTCNMYPPPLHGSSMASGLGPAGHKFVTMTLKKFSRHSLQLKTSTLE
ncbi:hypothetical protein TNCV_3322871 [Trichonephila clavipes]|nr:hypothetical protein TNCV_3322871 [Trichonephila clavipes]